MAVHVCVFLLVSFLLDSLVSLVLLWRLCRLHHRPAASRAAGKLGSRIHRLLRVASWWRNATGNVLQRWRRREPPDDGRRRKFYTIPYRRCLVSTWAHERSEKTPCERAGGGLVKVKQGQAR